MHEKTKKQTTKNSKQTKPNNLGQPNQTKLRP